MGLVAVNAPPGARLGARLRPLAKPLLGAFLALIGVLAPIEGPDLPEPLESLAETRSALAQGSTVITGSPDPCRTDPAPWSPKTGDPDYLTADECTLELPPCLAAPWDGSVFLQRSTEYPEFCEISVASTDASYPACTAMTGVVVFNDGATCRIIQNAICPSGVRVSPNNCRTVERRKWTCPSESIPRNEFNTCYKLPTASPGTVHPACGAGAPTLLIVDCADYVGDDFNQGLVCNDFDPVGHPDAFDNAANHYWCRFDSSLLDLNCHATGASCAESWALCLKRASRTGGCSVISKTIGCRDLQADYAADPTRLDAVRAALCEPCVILPFQPIPASCPDDLTDTPRQETWSRNSPALAAVLREETDIAIHNPLCYPVSAGTFRGVRYPGGEPLANHADCAQLDVPCPDPSPGRLAWTSNHLSQLAIVNTPVTIEILDIPTNYHTREYGYISGPRIRPWSSYVVQYPEPVTAEPDNIMRLWDHPNSARAYSSVAELASSSISGANECFLQILPQFKIIVQELWPDNPSDHAEIIQLFGTDALEWWDNIATEAEKMRRTTAQGIKWWDSLTAAEQEDRPSEMTQEVRCDNSSLRWVWCRWQTPKPGYYRLTGAGAWVTTDAGNRQWIDQNAVARVNDYLSRLTTAQRARLLGRLGVSSWAEAGINATGDALLPFTTDQDPLFSALSVQARCPRLDIRVVCLRDTRSGNYVETAPIGIMVHEMRVSTVTASN